MNIRNKIAVVLLAYADFESLEIALAAHTKFLPEDVHLFILQNGRGNYDCERTYSVAKRYEYLFARNVKVVDWIAPQAPYYAIRALLNSEMMQEFDYICKVDDDVFPLQSDWLDRLCECYEVSHEKYGDSLAYVTSLVNNNSFGFAELITRSYLKDEYFDKIARLPIEHMPYCEEAGIFRYEFDSKWDAIWRLPYISRWLHSKTTLNPEHYIDITKKLPDVEFNAKERYSINCMIFRKQYWNDIFMGDSDDEYSSQMYCKENNKKIVVRLSVPFVHLFFFTQRDENKDLLPLIRECYQNWLDLPFPVSLCPLKEYENENRLRFLEKQMSRKKESLLEHIFSLKNRGDHKVITICGIKIKINRKKSPKE